MNSVSQNENKTQDLKNSRRVRSKANSDPLPPHSIENEQGALGCCLISPNESIAECIGKLKESSAFYDLRHQAIYEMLVRMFDEKTGIDITTVMQRLKDAKLLDKIGGIPYLTQLVDCVPSAANLSYYLEFIHEKFLLRKMISVCSEVVGRVYDYEGEVDALMDEVERDILKIRPAKQTTVSIKELVLQAIGEIEQKWKTTEIMGLSTGLTDLDKTTDGLHGGEMIVLAALPSRGKSSLAGNIADYNAQRGIPVGFLTAEMIPKRIVRRSIFADARENFYELTETSFLKLAKSAEKISKSAIFYEQVSGLSILQVKAILRRMIQKNGIRLLVIDYIQRLNGTGDTMEQKISSISKGIKDISLEFQIPTLCLSQLTPSANGMKTKYASAISEDADSLWFLENDGEWEREVQKVNLKIEKSRDGSTGNVPLIFNKKFTKFECPAKVEENDIPLPLD